MIRHVAVTLALSGALAGCASLSHRGGDGQRLQLDRLYFGRAVRDTGVVTDSAWAGFMREVVTPAFPAGVTSWRAEGQWRDARGRVEREATMVLEVVHEPTDGADGAIRAVIAEYRRRFLQESVLRVSTSVVARF